MAARNGRAELGRGPKTVADSPAAVARVVVPRRRASLVSRRRLLDFLHQHLDRRLELVVAPAGYGKTALLIDFAHEAREQGVPVCWLTLEESERDVRTFFEHLLLSLRRQFPHFGGRTAALLAGVEDAGREATAIAGALCNELGDQINEFFILVLDDYHLVESAATINTVVDCLIQRLPEGCHVLLGSRTIPTQLNLARLAAQLQVAGVGTADLRFQAEETSELIRAHAGVGVHPREAERAARRAEGWVTAILLSLHAQESARFSGLLRAKAQAEPVYNYLATQVYARLPAAMQEFLRESAVLPALSVEECNALLGRTDAAERLAEIVQAGLFVEPIDTVERAPGGEGAAGADDSALPAEGEGWLRFHQLWREFLLHRLEEDDPARLTALRCRAAARALEQGERDAAVQHLLHVPEPDWDHLGKLVAEFAEGELAAGRAARLLGWIEALPAAALDARPLLLVFGARALSTARRIRDMYEMAQRAEEQAANRRDWEVIFAARAQKGLALVQLGKPDEAVQTVGALFDVVRRQPRPAALLVRLERDACLTLGMAGRNAESVAHGDAALADVQSIRAVQERTRIAAMVHQTMGVCEGRQGHAHLAEEHYRQGLRLWKELGNTLHEARVLNGIALQHLRAGQYESASAVLNEALALATRVGHVSTQVGQLINLARCRRESGELELALKSVTRSLTLAREIEEKALLGEALQEDGLLALRRRETFDAIQSLESALDIAKEQWPGGVALTHSLLALAYARAGQHAAAQAALAAARPAALGVRSPEDRLRCAVAQAAAEAALEREAQATATLRLARRAAREHNLQRTLFVECAQYFETSRQMLRERKLPAGAVGLLRSSAQQPIQLLTHEDRGRPALRVLPPAAGKRFELRLLGEPSLHVDGEAVRTWRTNLVRELFYYLAMHQDTLLRTEKLVDALLPDADYDRALTAVRHAVYHLRRVFAPLNPIETSSGGYRFRLQAGMQCDVVEFERLIAEARNVRGEGALRCLDAAIALYHGPLLDGFDAEWVRPLRADLERRFLAVAHALLNTYEEHHQHEPALALAQRVLALEPYLEEFHLALLRHQIALGFSAAAQRHYVQYSRLMREELGHEPSLEAQRLVAQLGPAPRPLHG